MRGAYPAARVGAVLVEQHAHERLDARQEDRALLELVLVGQRDVGPRELDRARPAGRIGRGLRGRGSGPVGRRLDVRRVMRAPPAPQSGQVTLPPGPVPPRTCARAGRGARPSRPRSRLLPRCAVRQASVRGCRSSTRASSGTCIAMSRAISSWRNSIRISVSTVGLPAARASARWNWTSSCRKRSSWRWCQPPSTIRRIASIERSQRLEVLLGRALGGQQRDLRLEHPARLEHRGDLRQAQQRAVAHEVGRHDVGRDVHAAARARAAPRARRRRRAP